MEFYSNTKMPIDVSSIEVVFVVTFSQTHHEKIFRFLLLANRDIRRY